MAVAIYMITLFIHVSSLKYITDRTSGAATCRLAVDACAAHLPGTNAPQKRQCLLASTKSRDSPMSLKLFQRAHRHRCSEDAFRTLHYVKTSISSLQSSCATG